MRRVTRRRALELAVSGAVLLPIAACRSSKNESSTTSSGGAARQATSAAGGTRAAGASGTAATGGALTASDVGVTPTEIKLGIHAPKTGSYAAYYAIVQGMQGYFEYVNQEQNGVNGRKINFIIKDDQTSPPAAQAVVREMVDNDKVFAFTGCLGTPQHSAVADYINEQKIPDMLVFTGAGKWNDPKTYPWTTAFTFSYPIESQVLAEYAKKTWQGKKVAVLYQNDDFGKDYVNDFGNDIKGSLTVIQQQSYETTASDISSQMTALKNSGADVLALWATPKYAVLAYKFLRDSGWKPDVIMTSVSNDPTVVQGAGADVMEGTITAGYLPDISDDSNPNVQKHKQIMSKYQPGVQASNFTFSGYAQAELTVEVLKRAGANLTRQGVMKAQESLRDFKFSALGPASMTPQDHAALHCEQPQKFTKGIATYFGSLICTPVKGM